MDRATQRALNAINRRFYAAIAEEWREKRGYPWPGFARILPHLPEADGGGPLRVLDVGCGDGRFAHYLHDRLSQPLDYLGVDFSVELLAHARARDLGASFRFAEHDFSERDPPPIAAGARGFDLICVLGVVHHVPGRAQRESLLRALAQRLARRGLLVLTFWRLPDDARFASRVLPVEHYNQSAHDRLEPAQLEAGDTLLRWGSGAAPPRYCHFPDATETQQLLAATGLRLVESFRADGRGEQLNEYALLTR